MKSQAAREPTRPPTKNPSPPSPPSGASSFWRSLQYAWSGLLHAATQRNMKIHLVASTLVALVGSGLRLGLAEKVTLIFCVMLVLFAEILNTALEALVDLHTEEYRELAKITKDVAAAGVLLLSLGTVVVFAALLAHNLEEIVKSGEQIARQAAAGLPLAGVVGLLLGKRGALKGRFSGKARANALFVTGIALWSLLATWSVSSVFSALSAALLFFAWRVARKLSSSSKA